jgi:YidC/Oxa1 family membrane protein insertase
VQFGFFEVFSGALTALYAVVQSLGLAIILLTVAVRLLLVPLSVKQLRSMREMQRLQPEIRKLQAKYKGDRQKMNEELMKLYREQGASPFGGCLPTLLQFPVLLALFYVIRTPLKYMGYQLQGTDWVQQHVSGIMQSIQESQLARDLDRHTTVVNHFLAWRLDCTPTEVWSNSNSALAPQACGSGDWFNILPYAALILLMGATTYYQQKQLQAQRTPGDPQAAQMQMIMRIMPLMLMVFAVNFPTGVVLYWITTNLWTIGQQHLMFAAVQPAGGAAGDRVPKKGDKPRSRPLGDAKTTKERRAPSPSKSGGARSSKASGDGSRSAARQPSGRKRRKR